MLKLYFCKICFFLTLPLKNCKLVKGQINNLLLREEFLMLKSSSSHWERISVTFQKRVQAKITRAMSAFRHSPQVWTEQRLAQYNLSKFLPLIVQPLSSWKWEIIKLTDFLLLCQGWSKWFTQKSDVYNTSKFCAYCSVYSCLYIIICICYLEIQSKSHFRQ